MICSAPKGRRGHACEVSVQFCIFISSHLASYPARWNVNNMSLCMTFDLIYLFSRNSRMWMGRSTMQICPPWPRRPPRAARTSTSCLSPRCRCQSQSNLLDQVSHFSSVHFNPLSSTPTVDPSAVNGPVLCGQASYKPTEMWNFICQSFQTEEIRLKFGNKNKMIHTVRIFPHLPEF